MILTHRRGMVVRTVIAWNINVQLRVAGVAGMGVRKRCYQLQHDEYTHYKTRQHESQFSTS